MKPQLNQENLDQTIKLQQKASDPSASAFVLASAGSGKTKILTDRVLRLLLSGVLPSKILCLTFTKVAAFEMQSRIYEKLSNWSTLNEEELRKEIADLNGFKPFSSEIQRARTLFNVILDDFEGIKINTIHSFCQNLMAKFPIEAKIKPNFQIIDSQTEQKLLIEAKNKFLKEALSDKDLAAKISLISANLNEKSFLEIILELIKKRSDLEISKEKFFGLKNLNEMIFKILGSENEDEITKTIENPDLIPEFDRKNLELISDFAKNSDKKTDLESSQLMDIYLKNPNLENFNSYLSAFLTLENEPRKKVFTQFVSKKMPESGQVIEAEQQRIINLREKIAKLEIAKLTTTLLTISDRILEIYFDLKDQNNYLDYNDLIFKTAKLLNNTENSNWVKYKLDGAFEHILVDESQDTNQQQWQIIKAISEDFFSGNGENEQNRTMFVVGDEKQSIYQFQGAQPRIFSDVVSYYSAKLKQSEAKFANIELHNSFRSLKNILLAVDKVFSDPARQRAISKINLVKHSAIRFAGSGKVELWPIINVKKEEKADRNDFSWKLDFDKKNNFESKEILAKIIAKKIKYWLDNKIILASQNRPIKAGDIMILLKNRTNNLGNLIIQNLQKENIAVSGSDKVQLIKNIIIKDLLSLARFLLLNDDDLNLASLLRSPFFNLSEDDLFELCQIKNQAKKEEKISLFSTLSKSEEKICQKAFVFLEEIKEHYQNNPYQIYQLFVYFLEVRGKKTAIIANYGKESKEIINHFLNLCLNFEENEISALENFINNLDNFSDFDVKIDNNNDFDEVKITTIHSAKGLEAPIVILADSAHDNRGQYGANNDRILWLNYSQDLDDIKIPIWPAGRQCDLTQSIKEAENNLKQDEYLRLLYVAMTRAKDELYIAGFGRNLSDDCWYNIVKNSVFSAEFSKKSAKKSNFNELADLPSGLSGQDFLENDEILFLEEIDNQSLEPVKSSSQEQNEHFILPDFLKENNFFGQKIEKTQNILYPSLQNQPENQQNQGQNYQNLGKIIHKILEIFPGNFKILQQKEGLIEQYLDSNHQYLTNPEKEEILRQVKNIFNNPKFSFIFGANSKSEVPVIADINGEKIIGKIDRLIISENEVIIIDYKSDKISAEEAKSRAAKYQEQLFIYQKIIEKIYPDKVVKPAIIWTYIGEISFL